MLGCHCVLFRSELRMTVSEFAVNIECNVYITEVKMVSMQIL